MAKIKVINPTLHVGNKNLKQRPKVAAYCRVSTSLYDQLQSLSAQIEHYTELIKSNSEWEFAGVYADEGISGRYLENRNEFIRMINDCEDGKINVIITKSISRFARNTRDFLEITKRLKEIGVSVYFEKENMSTSNPESDIILTTLSIIAEEEAEEISKNVRWGIQKRFETGEWKVTKVPYGYKRDKNGNVEITNKEAIVVKRIFDDYLNGKGTYIISKELEEEKIEPPRNKDKWCDLTILNILRNEMYVGDLLLQKTYTETVYPYKMKQNKGEKPKYLIKDNHEAIIPREKYEKVKKLIEVRTKNMNLQSQKYNNRYIFTSKIVCGECGNILKRQIVKQHSVIIWSCKQHIRDKKECSMKSIKEEYIEKAFENVCNKLIGNYKIILVPLLDDLKKLNYSVKYETQIQYINNRIKELKEQSYILSRLKSEGMLDSAFYVEKNNIIIGEINQLKKEYKNLMDSQDNEKIYLTEEIMNIIKNQKEYVECFDETIFEQIIEKVVIISPEQIIFQLINGLELVEYIRRR